MTAKTIDGFFVDPSSSTFAWFQYLLDKDERDCMARIVTDVPETDTSKLRGRIHQISRLKTAFTKASSD